MYHISRAGRQFIVSLLDVKGEMLSTSPMYKTKAECFNNVKAQFKNGFGSGLPLNYLSLTDEKGEEWIYSEFDTKMVWRKITTEEYFEG